MYKIIQSVFCYHEEKANLLFSFQGSLTVISVNGDSDACKCVPEKTRRGPNRCIKPYCLKGLIRVDEKGCHDKRKCRLKKKRQGRSLFNHFDQ